ncbi:sigma-70 family RNA polymerase sigma factor [Kribbella sp. CA-293567]|uniref:sigma-70 family RNA polymerase sigma factor n=1 Tax=Kribbella sp. CA-293567 TaxID=3002436 RepID=UPI0022DD0170|nr:sigma-70 family RNA polymerase sigma factor [Kribbella sp. CA-293567]WBQ05131.1 sigma-70 family RNA polymerase sigma factor [Kribbella sp. CA-293567]
MKAIELCLAERETLRRYVQSLVGWNTFAVEDVIQETLLRAWVQAETLDWESRPIRMWLFRVARNLVVDLHRRESRAIPVGLCQSEFESDLSEPDPAERVTDRTVLVEALNRLSPAHREVVTRVHLCGHPGEDVALALDVPIGTVKSRTHTAVRTLRGDLLRRGWGEAAA